MDKLLRRLIPGLEDHLSDDRLASLFCGELLLLERWIARWHLETCWQCRLRQEELEGHRSDRMFDHCRDVLAITGLSKEPEAEFARMLKQRIQTETPQKARTFRLPKIPLPELSPMNPALVVCIVFGFASAISFFLWRQQRVPGISSNTLLVRAERWDTPNLGTAAGVVYQAVRITTPKQTLERQLYRDVQGKRLSRRVELTPQNEQLKDRLSVAGLDWNEPLSASSYQEWHDHQHVRQDEIVRAGTHLLTLTTTVPDGSISQQSLTVRDTDFHPVRRTVAFRDSGTVEIAELDFKVLPWSAVDANVFEPIGNVETAVSTAPARVIPFPRLPETLSEEQLAMTELTARLVLNQLHADTGEQIEVDRTAQGIEVKGLVESEERKRELEGKLQTVPHLTVALESVTELKTSSGGEDGAISIKTATMPDEPSPLETYLLARGQTINAINVLAERLFNSALTVSQESKAIADLQARFIPGEQKTVLASATLSELIYSHHERLKEALQQERAVLSLMQPSSGKANKSTDPHAPSLMDTAARNLNLCKELTKSNGSATQSAEGILAGIAASLDDLTAGARHAYGQPQGDAALSERK